MSGRKDRSTQHQQNNATLVQQAIEAERKARKAERRKAWNAAHPESLAEYKKKWDEANQEHAAEYFKSHREAKGWEAQLAVCGSGGAAARAARAAAEPQSPRATSSLLSSSAMHGPCM
jgi:hypothetical protein